jgi:isoleucyl-tRNA synthetase
MSEGELEARYKGTVDLPETDFPMRGNGPVRELEFQENWDKENIYQASIEKRQREKADKFILHDGPPYLSSDRIHIGTALNKILKDIVIKYKSQRGFEAPYIPGYDSHGLPIENAVVKDIKGGREAVSILELRERCKEFALSNLKGQEAKFKRLGVMGAWDKPYVTLDPRFEAEQIRLFGEMAAKGYIYRGLKTVFWSYGCETALADAEVEYNEEHKSNSIYVSFPIKSESFQNLKISKKLQNLLDGAFVLIWTTTPWTIPANLAISLHPDLNYVLAEILSVKDEDERNLAYKSNLIGRKILLAENLLESVSQDTKLELKSISGIIKGNDLEGIVTKHPLYNRESPLVFGEHVSSDSGTGCVHTAPGHGQEDFEIGKKYRLETLCPVDPKGFFTGQALAYKHSNFGEIKLEGIHTVEKRSPDPIYPEKKISGNELVIEFLKDSKSLLGHKTIVHSYPYCWRSKTPLLYRATEQWFASIDAFRTLALSEINKVEWIPERSRNRIYAMVQERGDWCISRQRTWGVPIPAFYDKSQIDENGNYKSILDPEIIEHVAKIFETEGSSAWYAKKISDLIPQTVRDRLELSESSIVKETDTMDVWFDSGSTHRSVVSIRPELCPDRHFKPVDLYLEGSDQHRGWFQSSLLSSVATNGFAPYKAVLTHGFVMDEKGKKMSKSAGNVVDPEKVIKQYGADILRLWVASVDYSVDIKVGDNMFKQLSDIYRNFRNTSRYMLANLSDFDPSKDRVGYSELWRLDQIMLHKIQKLIESLTESFDKYQFFKYYQLIQNFCSVDLSAFYFDILKDRLYTHGTKSLSRRAAQTVLLEMLSVISRIFVPVLPHLAEDIFIHLPEKTKKLLTSQGDFDERSILLSNWPSLSSEYLQEDLSKQFNELMELRDIVNKELEILRANKSIAKSLEGQIEIMAPTYKIEIYKEFEEEIKAIFMVADFKFTEASDSTISVKASKFDGVKCLRCWKYFKSSEINDGICGVCRSALNKLELV